MEIIKNTTNYDIIKWRYITSAISLVFIALTAYLWFTTGDAKFGVDFRGGSELVVKYSKDIEIGQVREALDKAGFDDALVQNFEGVRNEFSVRLGMGEGDVTARARGVLTSIPENQAEVLREEFVGPVIGEQIRRDAIIAFIISVIGIFIYVVVRFDAAFAAGAIVALLHDGIIATGITILAGKQLGAHTLAALLTIVGFSVNDTIVIYDRIRENLALANKTGSAAKKGVSDQLRAMTLAQIMNRSINETFSRTILTTLTVLFIVLTLWLAGTGSVSDLSFTLLIGCIAGTYSTIFIACPVILAFRGSASKVVEKEKK